MRSALPRSVREAAALKNKQIRADIDASLRCYVILM